MRKILVVVDMQNDFIDGSLGTKEACAIVDKVLDKIGQYPKKDIIATRDTHSVDYLETQEGKKLPVAHCIKNTEGWQFNEKIAKALEGAQVLDKLSFGSLELAELLAKENEKEAVEVEMVGLCTDICVVSNALILKAKLPEVSVTVDSACCAGVTSETHEAALTTLRMCQVAVV